MKKVGQLEPYVQFIEEQNWISPRIGIKVATDYKISFPNQVMSFKIIDRNFRMQAGFRGWYFPL